jgi:16S rRNA (guanine(966)-N(2))-methyltransferase RsmD
MADAGRVIAGTARGVRLLAPGPATRPLADRVKQTLFAILDPDLPGARFLDLFAGSGAAGIEALSRGAANATFVERDPGAVAVIRANLRATGLAGPAATVARADALAWLARFAATTPPFDLAFVDPPYAESALLEAVLEALGGRAGPAGHLAAGSLAAGSRVIAKHFWRDRPPERIGMLAVERDRRFGETALTFYRREEDG